MVFIKFFSLISVGCSWGPAARHVWWDRFPEDVDPEASGRDSSWGLNMWAFLLGALPQAIKIYGMHGIPLTQATATIFLVSFITMEILRLTAGPAGCQELVPMPIVDFTKKRVKDIGSVIATISDISQSVAWAVILSYLLPSVSLDDAPVNYFPRFIAILPLCITLLQLSVIFFYGLKHEFFPILNGYRPASALTSSLPASQDQSALGEGKSYHIQFRSSTDKK
jgi:hypothetical protein